MIAPAPQPAGSFVVTARCFYAGQLVVSSHGAELAMLCRGEKRIGDIEREMDRRGAEPATVRQALNEMMNARLLLVR